MEFYKLTVNDRVANLYIFGDIYSDTSLMAEIGELDVDEINVYINSYGGAVSEGLAIYNALKNHKATVNTYCQGFACSIASVIMQAGDTRYMCSNSLLMIHNAWTLTMGNSEELRKTADDLEKINGEVLKIYVEKSGLSEDEVKQMLDDEDWITSDEAVARGFADKVIKEDDEIKQKVQNKLKRKEEPATPKPAEKKNEEKKILNLFNF